MNGCNCMGVPEAGASGRRSYQAGAGNQREQDRQGCLSRGFHVGEEAFDVADGFGEAGDGVFAVLFVFEADKALVFYFQDRRED